jgi:hypothetical protein
MKAIIAHFYLLFEPYETEIFDLQKWIVEHGGAVQVYPPGTRKADRWIIYVTDDNKFYQR